MTFASAFETTALDPVGEFDYAGIAFDQPFAADALARLGVEAQVARRKDFKTGADAALRSAPSDADRAQTSALADGWAAQVAAAVALGRGFTADAAVAALDGGPHLAANAVALGLVDRLAYWADMEAAFDEDALFDFGVYAAVKPDVDAAATVAFVPVIGPIAGGGAPGPFGGEVTFGYALEETLRDLAEDDAVDAALLFIDSPGGGYQPSDALREGVRALRAADKPVIALMGGVAASGGYFAAMAADAIYARPATITGSIGVYTGKLNFAGLWDLLGVNWAETAAGGPAAGRFSPHRGYTDAQWAKLNAAADAIYDDFV
ncbi:MAG: S49 family peptidase, partial [Pseudomonadota bacterium]